MSEFFFWHSVHCISLSVFIAFSMLSQRSVVSGVSSSSFAWFALFSSGNFVSSISDTAAKVKYGKIDKPRAMGPENVDDTEKKVEPKI